MSCGGFKCDAVRRIEERRGLRQMDLEGDSADKTLTSSLHFKIQQEPSFDGTCQTGLRTTSLPRMICVIARLRCVLNPGFHFLLLSPCWADLCAFDNLLLLADYVKIIKH